MFDLTSVGSFHPDGRRRQRAERKCRPRRPRAVLSDGRVVSLRRGRDGVERGGQVGERSRHKPSLVLTLYVNDIVLFVINHL